MTELLQTILLRVTIAGAVSAMALKLAGGGALKEVVRTAKVRFGLHLADYCA